MIRAGGRLLPRADGTLAGSELDMASAVRNSVRLLGLPLAEALRLAAATPAAFLGIKRTGSAICGPATAPISLARPRTVQLLAYLARRRAGRAIDRG